MSDEKLKVCFISIRAVMGIGAGDTFTAVEVPNEGKLEQTLEEISGLPIQSDDYARTDAYIKGFKIPEIYDTKLTDQKDAVSEELERLKKQIGQTPTVYVKKEPGTEPHWDEPIGKPSLEYAAVWAPNRTEWIGIKVKRTEILEGSWQEIDQSVECEGPFNLAEGWGQKILEAYKSQKSLDPKEVLHTEPSQSYYK